MRPPRPEDDDVVIPAKRHRVDVASGPLVPEALQVRSSHAIQELGDRRNCDAAQQQVRSLFEIQRSLLVKAV